jgi:hypothetical protein
MVILVKGFSLADGHGSQKNHKQKNQSYEEETKESSSLIQPGFEPGSGALCEWQAPMIPLHY